ncbi:MAG: LamG domain-containing protein [Pirellulaceae bacterium]
MSQPTFSFRERGSVSDDFDPYYRWLGIPPEEQPPHYYRLLGVRAFEPDEEVLQNAADLRMIQLRSAQIGKRAALSQQLLNEVAAARACLLNPRRRNEYDAQLKRRLGEQAIASPPPASPPALNVAPAAVDVGALPDLSASDPLQIATLPGTRTDAKPYAMLDGGYAPPAPRNSAKTIWMLALICGVLVLVLPLLAIPVVAVIALSGEQPAPAPPSPVVRPPRPLPRPARDDEPPPIVVNQTPRERTVPVVAGANTPTPADDSTAAVDATPAGSTSTPLLALNEGAPLKAPPAALLAGALLHYDFEPDAEHAADVVADRSGHGFDGQIKGNPQPSRVGSPIGGAALHFEGGAGALRVAGLTDALCNDLTELTVATWVAPEPNQKSGMIFDVGWYGTESITLVVVEEEIKFTLSGHHIGTGLTAPLGGGSGWRHVAAVWDGKEQRLYLDGKVVAREATRRATLNSKSINKRYPVSVGATAKWYKANERFFRGQIDELLVLPRGLTDNEVSQLYGVQRYSAPAATSVDLKPTPDPTAPPATAAVATPDIATPDIATPAATAATTVDGEPIDLIALVDLDKDARPVSKWKLIDGELHCINGVFRPKVVFPYEPPEEYDVKVVFSHLRLRNPISIILPKGDASFFFAVGGSKGHASFSVNPGQTPNPTTTTISPALVSNRQYTTLVQVRNDGVKAFFEGELVCDHPTDFRDLKTDQWRKIKETRQIAIDADDPAVFHLVELTEISGPGRLLRTP